MNSRKIVLAGLLLIALPGLASAAVAGRVRGAASAEPRCPRYIVPTGNPLKPWKEASKCPAGYKAEYIKDWKSWLPWEACTCIRPPRPPR